KLAAIFHGSQGNIAGFSYQWDSAHFKTEETLKHWGDVKNTFGYDGAHRTSSANIFHLPVQANSTILGYDGADNITSRQEGAGAQAFAYGTENRHLGDSDSIFAYDFNGNLTSHKEGNRERRFVYDYANRLVSAEIYENGQLLHSFSAEYDPLGRRTAKTADGVRTEFVYDGNQVVQELDQSGTVQREYIWGNGIDELIAIRQAGNTYYTHRDSIGSVVAVTDQNGTIVERYNYDAFGKPYIVREMLPPCVSIVTKQTNVLTVDFCQTVTTIAAESSDISIRTTTGNQNVPFTFSTSGDLLSITLADPLPDATMRLVVFGVEGDGTIIAERIERTFSPATEGQLDAGGSIFPVSVIVENSAINNPYLFQSREWNQVLQTYYYRAREYDPTLGRFLQQDSEWPEDGPNAYAGFRNSALNYTDPRGTTVGTALVDGSIYYFGDPLTTVPPESYKHLLAVKHEINFDALPIEQKTALMKKHFHPLSTEQTGPPDFKNALPELAYQFTGIPTLASGISGYDLTNNRPLSWVEAKEMIVYGSVQFIGFLTLPLDVGLGVSSYRASVRPPAQVRVNAEAGLGREVSRFYELEKMYPESDYKLHFQKTIKSPETPAKSGRPGKIMGKDLSGELHGRKVDVAVEDTNLGLIVALEEITSLTAPKGNQIAVSKEIFSSGKVLVVTDGKRVILIPQEVAIGIVRKK
ncbi:RHS repeat-associated core domain-containing protein, partial [bacterium]|nr:RHS repeat-associated core domain-containing protein [bacterium]